MGFDAAERLLSAWPALVEDGMPADDAEIRTLASSGLVQFVWRNGPVEDAHASRRGPTDVQMMTMSIDLGRRARRAVEGPRVDLLAFEAYVLDADRPWPGTNSLARRLLHGHIGEIRKHVKSSTNRLLAIEDGHSTEALLKFLCLNGDRSHVGMSDWAEIVRIIAEIVEGGVSADDAYVRLERLPDVLRTNPSVTLIDPSSDIAADDLQGLIASGLIMAAESTLNERRREAGPHLG